MEGVIESPDSEQLIKRIRERKEYLLKRKAQILTELKTIICSLRADEPIMMGLLNSLPNNTSNDSRLKMVEEERTELKASGKLEELYTKHRSLSHVYSYLICVQNVNEISQALMESLKFSSFVLIKEHVIKLRMLSKEMKASKCQRLYVYIKSVRKSWKLCLLKVFHLVMNNLLDKYGYPADECIKNSSEFRRSLWEMAQLCDVLYGQKIKCFDEFTQCLLDPLRKRFIFYFADPNKLLGASVVISDPHLPKPEWYLSLILKWHQRYTPVLQSIADGDEFNAPFHGFDVITLDFCRGLVILARERFKFDLTLVLGSEEFANDDKAFPHLIDEAVAFDVELRESGYPESDVGCMELLTEPGIFERWFELEHQQCTKCIESLLADQTAWSVRYSEATDLDHFKAPRCVDNFFSLLTAITQRYKLLRSSQHRLRFAHLQRTLIDDFRMHLFELTRSTASPWTVPFPQVINAVNYVKLVLMEWQESPFFVDLEPGIFDQLIDLFEHFRCQMLNDAKEAVMDEMRPLLALYRRNIVSQRFDDNAIATVLVPLQARLLEIKDLLSQQNFQDWLKAFASNFETILLENVLFEIRVDSKMGPALHEQMAVILPRLFHSVGLVDRGVHFQRLIACLSIYSLNVAGCLLLKSALQNQTENVAESILSEMNLSVLSLHEVDALLQRRSDISPI